MIRLRTVVLAALLGASTAFGTPLAAQEQGERQRIELLERQVATLLEQVEALQAASARQDSTALAQLRRQIEALTRQIEEMQLGGDVVAAEESRFGFGPAASKVYRVGQGVSIGGYGEMLYENFSAEREDGTASGAADRLDAVRAIVYVGYKFNDNVLFNSEIEFEHASTDQTGSVSLEFAYLDFLLTNAFNVRMGLLLMPMGFLNELHEAPIFLGTTRPEVERQIIPSTWRELGAGVFGETHGIAYRAYLVNGFDAVGGGSSDAAGFGAAGLRGGRQKGSQTVAEEFAVVGRADYVGQLGLTVGTSVYLGNSGQNRDDPLSPGARIDGRTLIWEGHAQYKARGFDLRGLLAFADVDDAASINAAKGLTGSASIGSRLVGGYLQAGYDVLRKVDTSHELLPYIRYERFNTQDAVPAGFSADPANNRTIVSLGVAWRPITNVIVKSDYQIHSNDADTGVNQFNLSMGYLF